MGIRYQRDKPISEEVRKKLYRSQMECSTLEKRDLRCPYCGFLIDRIYSDAAGHRESKCEKCKRITVFNMAYFRRIKRPKGFEVGNQRKANIR